jgi:hypothetical protein
VRRGGRKGLFLLDAGLPLPLVILLFEQFRLMLQGIEASMVSEARHGDYCIFYPTAG